MGRVLLVALVSGLAVALVLKFVLIALDPQTSANLSNPTLSNAALYRDVGQRILDGGPVYPAFQFNAYTQDERLSLYPPPIMLFLIAPMAALPAFLWWLVPLGVIAADVVRHRPSLLGWLGILLCLAWPETVFVIEDGDPVIWAAAFVALGTVWKGSAILALIKPSLAPFALVGVRSRWWWVWFAAYGAVALLMLPLWLDYLGLLANGAGRSLDLSLSHIPILLIPVVAWVTRTARSPRGLGLWPSWQRRFGRG